MGNVKPGKRHAMAALAALRWFAMPMRPGSVEELDAILGTDREGRPVEMRPEGSEIMASDSQGNEQRLTPVEISRCLIEGRFRPTHVRVKRNMTDRLFGAAVRAAEVATENEVNAQEGLLRLPDDDDSDESTWALLEVIGSLRDAVPPSLQAIVFAVAAAEAQVNAWGQWKGEDDLVPVEDKCKRLAREAAGTLQLGKGPGQWFMEAVDARHRIVHSRPGETETRSISKADVLSQALQARRACAGVRHVLVSLARLRQESPPDYLKASPPDPNDVKAWRTATVLAGLRDDPDFPK